MEALRITCTKVLSTIHPSIQKKKRLYHKSNDAASVFTYPPGIAFWRYGEEHNYLLIEVNLDTNYQNHVIAEFW